MLMDEINIYIYIYKLQKNIIAMNSILRDDT